MYASNVSLSASGREHGILQPLVVRSVNGQFQLIAGERRLRAEMERVLGADWCAQWNEGLPEFSEAPDQVNIIEILRLWTYVKSLDLVEWGRMRYNLLGNAGHWFPGEMVGKIADDGKLRSAISKNPFAGRIPEILREAHQLLFTEPKKRLSQS